MDVLDTVGALPQKITDITDNISKSAVSLDKMVDKLDLAVNNIQTNNPVSGALVEGLSKVTGAIDTCTDKIVQASNSLSTAGKSVSSKLQPISSAVQKVQGSILDLQNCQEVLSTSALLTNAIIDSCTGHFHPRANEQILNKFDNQWDSWAKIVNVVFTASPASSQTNILEKLARENFGDNVFALGSAVKNESAGIFGGIADFEDSLHAFFGSYRNPLEAAKKIETGVKGIVNATERVANSINNMVLAYKKACGQDAASDPILSYIGNLNSSTAIASLNKVLTIGGGAATLSTDITRLKSALNGKDLKSIYSAGKKTVSDARTILKGLKNAKDATKVTSLAKGTPTGGAASVDTQELLKDTAFQDDLEQDSGNADTYVCSGATMRCSFGDKKAKLTVYPDRTIFLTGQPMANITDHTSLYNIAPFGKCHTTRYPATAAATSAAHGKLTPMPCIPGTYTNWQNGKNDYIIKGDPALLKSSYCKCCYGGVITITDDGQKDTGKADMGRIIRETGEEWIEKEQEELLNDHEALLDGIQTALDIAGLVPGLGAIPDLTNAAIYYIRGDRVNAGISMLAAVPGIGDAATAAKLAGKGVRIAKAAKSAKKTSKGVKTINIRNTEG